MRTVAARPLPQLMREEPHSFPKPPSLADLLSVVSVVSVLTCVTTLHSTGKTREDSLFFSHSRVEVLEPVV